MGREAACGIYASGSGREAGAAAAWSHRVFLPSHPWSDRYAYRTPSPRQTPSPRPPVLMEQPTGAVSSRRNVAREILPTLAISWSPFCSSWDGPYLGGAAGPTWLFRTGYRHSRGLLNGDTCIEEARTPG